MSAQFTPGPWHAARKSPKTWHFGVYDANGTEVAHVAAHALHFLRREADARLIAASPDLLKACAAALAGYPTWQQMMTDAYTKATGNAP